MLPVYCPDAFGTAVRIIRYTHHSVQNGLLLRTDIHALFDKGYITIDDKYIINVSNRLYEDFGNGKIYYAHHGQKLFVVPAQASDKPSGEFLSWHNEHVYLG